mgnify:CR=1 FL=1
MKNTAVRVGPRRVIGLTCVKPLIPSEHPEKAFFATQEPFLQSERTILPSEPSKLPKSPQNAIFGNKKADRITPIGSHTCHVLVSFN